MNKYRVISLDVLGNSRTGFEVNDAHYTGEIIELRQNFTNKDVIRALKGLGHIRRGFRFASFVIDGETDYTLYVDHVQRGPVVYLERVK